jgi:hypothetical protein
MFQFVAFLFKELYEITTCNSEQTVSVPSVEQVSPQGSGTDLPKLKATICPVMVAPIPAPRSTVIHCSKDIKPLDTKPTFVCVMAIVRDK